MIARSALATLIFATIGTMNPVLAQSSAQAAPASATTAAQLPQAAATAAPQAGSAANDPYEVRVPLAEDTNEARGAALAIGLQQVLVRVSGASPQAFGSLPNATTLAEHFGAQRDPATGALFLSARFYPASINDLVRQLGYPVFGVSAGPVEAVTMTIDHVFNVGDFARVQRYLAQIPGVSGIALRSAAPEQLVYDIQIEGGEKSLESAVALGDVLSALGNGEFQLR